MNKENVSLKFTVNKNGRIFSAQYENRSVAECTFDEGILDFWTIYDYRPEEPLHLKGKAKCGDEIKINIFPHRIEMYISNALADEEWPYGNNFLDKADIIADKDNFYTDKAEEIKRCEPNVTGRFKNAEGWKPEENVFVGDCMPYEFDGAYHVLYLRDRHHHKSKWGQGGHQWDHISTKNFVDWDIHPTVVKIEDPEEASFCTGSWFYDNGTHYLFYTVRNCKGEPAGICRSTSADGFHFEKDKGFCFFLSDKYTAISARDPKVFKADDGKYHMILTTSLTESKRGCLAHLISEDMNEWCEAGEFYIAPEDMGEPECPDYFYKDGFYYLVCSLRGNGFYQYSKNPFDGWQKPENPIIPCKTVPKAAVWNNRLIFTGFDKKGQYAYAGVMTFLEASVKENGELEFKA